MIFVSLRWHRALRWRSRALQVGVGGPRREMLAERSSTRARRGLRSSSRCLASASSFAMRSASAWRSPPGACVGAQPPPRARARGPPRRAWRRRARRRCHRRPSSMTPCRRGRPAAIPSSYRPCRRRHRSGRLRGRPRRHGARLVIVGYSRRVESDAYGLGEVRTNYASNVRANSSEVDESPTSIWVFFRFSRPANQIAIRDMTKSG